MAELRRRQPESVDSLLQEQYLAAEEQEEVIVQLKAWHAKQTKLWTSVFAALAVLLGGGCLHLALHQVMDPWGLRHHAYFYHTVNKYGIAAAEACNGISLLLSGMFLMLHYQTSTPAISRWQPPLFYANLSLGLLVAAFWLLFGIRAAKYQEDSVFLLWRHAWLPLAPVGYMALSLYLVRTFGRTSKDIDALRASMYSLHSA